MIYRLRRKFILICTASILSVVVLIFGAILVLNISSMNRNMDILADSVSTGGGRFPSSFGDSRWPDKLPPINERFDFITPETPFSTRHFTVLLNKSGEIVKTHLDAIYSITEEQAVEYAQKVLENGRERGWLSHYRYKVFETNYVSGVVFIDGSVNRSALVQSMTISGAVLIGCAALVLLLIILLSQNAVKPIAESYEKQKQFVTDANHELKTPLTLILANLDIAETELGKNEWLDDIRAEGHRMTELVNQLVALSRMDEEEHTPEFSTVPIGKIVSDTVSEFEPLAEYKGKQLEFDIDSTASCQGDEALLTRLVGILMDNAIKYCDAEGEIFVTLTKHRNVTLTVENTYAAVDELELPHLFDRFYRADKARKFTGGYGVGLSMAKAITEKHKGEITAHKKDSSHIEFKVVLKA